jgi:hypothetical protein
MNWGHPLEGFCQEGGLLFLIFFSKNFKISSQRPTGRNAQHDSRPGLHGSVADFILPYFSHQSPMWFKVILKLPLALYKSAPENPWYHTMSKLMISQELVDLSPTPDGSWHGRKILSITHFYFLLFVLASLFILSTS